ncbi:hypothetical protein [Deinococcus aestuarii]|uniref:hypothetical protein n=1 Tax=Deinococcus aestuarii TaxID=2774531 RepID=UPI001C0B93E9|nr:hypothetical protein [Deinococcus aestuarii]
MPPARLLAPLLTLAVTLAGCAPVTVRPARAPALDLSGPVPDVVILSVSGRCAPPCLPPRDNWDYLTSRGTVDLLADAIAGVGYRVQVAGYASNAAATYVSRQARAEQRGYAALAADFARMREVWLEKPRPPRLVLLGHSQGVAWLHHLARVNPDVPFALQIDLDGICAAWRSDHGAALRAQPPGTSGTPSALTACDLVRVPGRTLRNKDVVWPNVARHLEVLSKRLPARASESGGYLLNYLFDPTRNARPDGSTRGLEVFVSGREDHSAVSYPNSDALAWAAGRTVRLAQDWKRADAGLAGLN